MASITPVLRRLLVFASPWLGHSIPSPLPLALHMNGWVLNGTAVVNNVERAKIVCAAGKPGCAPVACKVHVKGTVHSKGTRLVDQSVCERCECSLCSACAVPKTVWTSPSGQRLETTTTGTHPRFTFAYQPLDWAMNTMHASRMIEPGLTRAWLEQTRECCRTTGGLVIDIGANYGWYSLYSLALGCDVVAFEPVPSYQEIIKLGVSLNPGFSEKFTLYGNLVYNEAGEFAMHVPTPTGRYGADLGISAMEGSAGVLKRGPGSQGKGRSYAVKAPSARVDELVSARLAPGGGAMRVCMMKADVEGYEPQALATAQMLFHSHPPAALQLEMTRTSSSPNQTCAYVRLLEHLDALGYTFRQVDHVRSHALVRETGPLVHWSSLSPVTPGFNTFPSDSSMRNYRRRTSRGTGVPSRMKVAYEVDFRTFSTNLIGMHNASLRAPAPGQWPPLTC